MTYEAHVGVAAKNVTFLSWEIFYCVVDRLAQKHSLFVES